MWRFFSIIIPIYNESENIVPLYNEIYGAITQDFPNYDFEIIFVNDWSTDNSWNRICDAKMIQKI